MSALFDASFDGPYSLSDFLVEDQFLLYFEVFFEVDFDVGLVGTIAHSIMIMFIKLLKRWLLIFNNYLCPEDQFLDFV